MNTLLSINNYYYVRGGAEAVFLDHNDIFEHLGWRVVPFSMRHPKNRESSWQDYFVDEIELGTNYGPLEKLAKSLKAIYSREAARKIDRLVGEVRPAIAHAHNVYHHLSPSVLIQLKKRGVPVVVTLHDLKLVCPSYRMIAGDRICERCKPARYWQATRSRCMHRSLALSMWVTAEAYFHKLLGSYERSVDKFVVPSRFYIDKFCEWGWDRNRFEYIPNFVEADRLEPEYAPGTDYVFFGRLSHEKGVSTLIRAAAAAGVGVRIVGTGPEEERLRALAAELGGSVEFSGYLSGSDLFDALRRARAIVLPSEWYENAPISVLEAFAIGKPVIGADIGGIPELVTEQRGTTFRAFSAESLAGQLARFSAMDDGELETMGRSARAYVLAEHSRSSYRERCLRLYAALGADV